MLLKVSPLISSGMVLQQGAAAPIRGQAAPGAEITVSFLGKAYRAAADSGGAWQLLLDSQPPGGPYSMEIAANGEKIALDDIYIGDVWLCSGQSNMELPMQRLKDDYPEEWAPPINALIRQFKVPQEWEFSGPRGELSGGCWKAAGAQTLDEFSGTAWFFARALYENHPVPVGLINAAWGGTPAEAWMSREALTASAVAGFPAKIAAGDQYNNSANAEIARTHESAIQAWEDRAAAADQGLAEAWQRPETDTAAWGDISLPDNFAGSVPADFCGVIWLRREFEADAEFAAGEARLWMGTIVDADTAYVNGVEVGNTPYRYPPCKYIIPAGLLHAGKNQIVVRVICRDGEGGVTKGKAFRVFSEMGSIELGGVWKYRIGASVGPRPAEFFFQRQPMCLFNAMIAPVLGFPLKGVIWYQGESNDPNPHEYAALFPALINDWRKRNNPGGSSPLPFLFVQLPIFGDPGDNNESSSWAIIREAQAQALSLPATGMAAGLELGEWNDLHPINKKGIGRRLALAAEKTVFGQPNTSPGPMVRGVERRGNRVLITFDNCGGGLTYEREESHAEAQGHKGRKDKRKEEERGHENLYLPLGDLCASVPLREPLLEPPHLSVIAGGESFRLLAEIDGTDCISIDISTIKNPEKILYAWANNPRDRQLFNADGLPVIPFRIKL
jgi:sialate O-acetylesterase